MNAKITIHNMGPIHDSEIYINKYMVFTGPQASGKSTVAKVIYYFMTIRRDFAAQFSILPNFAFYNGSTLSGLNKRLRNKFLGVFGSSWAMNDDMKISCEYAEGVSISVYLQNDKNGTQKNYVEFAYSRKLKDIMKEWDAVKDERNEAESQDILIDKFSKLFNIDFETIYIPAGRGMITLLTDQISYIFSTPDDASLRVIDYCTKDYVSKILKLRPLFMNGIEGAINDKKYLTQESIDFDILEEVKENIQDILKGKYYFQAGEERLYLAEEDKYVKINYASSGQQEVVWVLNVIFHFLLEKKKVFLILEEPEAHLYPDAQKKIMELLTIFYNAGNLVLTTTHSPYVLGQMNNMLMAEKIKDTPQIEQIIKKSNIIKRADLSAYHTFANKVNDAMDEDLIDNSLIDGASKDINDQADKIMDIIMENESDD